MPSTFRNPTAIAVCVLLLALLAALSAVSSKSIIRELMEQPQLAPDGKEGRTISRGNRQFDEFPIERCRITQTKPELSGKLNRLCDECYQLYRVPNYFVMCRARCYNNEIIKGCSMALYRNELKTELDAFYDSPDVKRYGITMPPPAQKGPTELGLQLLQKLESA